MSSDALHLSNVPYFASRPYPQHIDKNLVPKTYKYMSPHHNHLYGTLAMWTWRF